jgi:hypothetical protein
MNIMAKSVTVVVSDDLDGSPNAQTLTFGFDGVTYEIDLSEHNRDKLAKLVAPYIEAGRRVGRGRRATTGRPPASRGDRAAVRAWAKEHGITVSERGRISADVISQYEASH